MEVPSYTKKIKVDPIYVAFDKNLNFFFITSYVLASLIILFF